jgi:CRP-like cAMP-binding protein
MASRVRRRHAGAVAPLSTPDAVFLAPPRLDMLSRPSPVTVRVADADPDLLSGLDRDLTSPAAHQLVARVVTLPVGPWPQQAPIAHDFTGWLGMLVLSGLLIREVDLDGLCCCELLGPGDVLRPWDEDGPDAALRSEAAWRVVEPARIALLDAGFARRACRWPSIVTELMHRSLMRSRSLTVLLAATQARRADVRLRTLFWHLADRWGRVTPEGVRLDLPLTHTIISRLTSLRRPTVSLSLAQLEQSGEIVRVAKTEWILRSGRLARELAA